jgi:hypothetical protein
MELKLLDIVTTKSRKKLPILSWAIMWWTGKKYSHVARAVEIRDWGKRYFQASEGKVNYEYEKYFLKKHEIIKKYTIEIPKELDSKIKKACYQEAGNTYGTLQNIGIFFTDIYYRLFRKETKNPWTKGRNCSELLYADCFKIIIPELDYKENKIKPHQIVEIIETHFDHGKDDVWRLKVQA